MISNGSRSTIAALLGMLAAVSYSGAANAVEKHQVIVLFDRSGSMRLPGICEAEGSKTKAQCAMSTLLKLATSNPESPLTPFCAEENDPNNANPQKADFFFWGFRSRAGESDYILPNPTKDVPATGMNGLGGFFQVLSDVAGEIAPGGSDPPVANDFTPLAQAYCKAVNFLYARKGNPATAGEVIQAPGGLHVIVVSDGLQEPLIAAPDGTCNGPDTTTAHKDQNLPISVTRVGNDLFATGTVAGVPGNPGEGLWVSSWQANMLDMAVSGTYHQLPSNWPTPSGIPDAFQSGVPGNAFQPPTAGSTTPAIVEVDFIKNFVGGSLTAALMLGGGSAYDDGDAPAPRTAVSAAVDPPSPTGEADFIRFLSTMASATGGRLMIPDDPTDPNGPHILPGDADDSLCVDLADFNIMRQFFGQKINLADPLSLDADVTYDGIIDDRDYLLIKE
ncbi:MAG TPA: hypothetical protein VIV60_18250, partial [Polyangiaceae bacterium]